MHKRLNTLLKWIAENRLFRNLFNHVILTTSFAALTLTVIGFLIVGYGYNLTHPDGTWATFVSDFYANGGAELFSIAITVFVIERLNDRRATRQQKADLILQLGSPDNAFAVEAARILAQKGWLYDGSLKSVDLYGANLSGADLQGANLSDCKLWKVNLSNAKMRETFLRGSYLIEANLIEAYLMNADLSFSYLRSANLSGSFLAGANLSRADLREANLSGCNLLKATLNETDLTNADFRGANLRQARTEGCRNWDKAIFDENTILPNGEKWHPGLR